MGPPLYRSGMGRSLVLLLAALALFAGTCSAGEPEAADSPATTPSPSPAATEPAPPPPAPAPASPAAAVPLLRLDGIGPLMLGMSEADAEATGWLSNRSAPWCPFAGTEDPTWDLAGPSAPAGVDGYLIFREGEIDQVVIRSGTTTDEGIGAGASFGDLSDTYGGLGYEVDSYARFESFDDFATVEQADEPRLMTTLNSDGSIEWIGVPYISVCD